MAADETGLSWTVGRQKHHTPWDEVVGYYDQRCPTASPFTQFAIAPWQLVVQTRQATLVLRETWNNERSLRGRIQRYATSATMRKWGCLRRDPDDWPGVFHYDTWFNRNSLRWLRQWHWAGIAAVSGYFAWAWVTAHTFLGWAWLLTPMGFLFLSKQFGLAALYPSTRRTVPYLTRKIKADMDGLRFIDGNAQTAVAWGDITDFYCQGNRSVIVTTQGERDFVSTIANYEWLRMLIPRYAVNAAQIGWGRRGKYRSARSTTWYQSRADGDRND